MENEKKMFQNCHFEVKAIDEIAKTIEVVMTTDEVDTDNEVVVTNGMILEKNRESIPVFLDHKYHAENVVGKVMLSSVKKEKGKTSGVIEFAREESPKADLIFKLMKGGYLTDVSIGYITTKAHYEVKDGKNVRFIDEWILIELTVAGLGANRSAMKKALEDGIISQKEMDAEENDEDVLKKSIGIFQKNHEITKTYRKTFEKMRKMLNVEATGDEEEDTKKTYKALSDLLSDFGVSETPMAKKEAEMRPISKKELDEMLEKF